MPPKRTLSLEDEVIFVNADLSIGERAQP